MCDIVDYLYIVDYLLYVYKLIINYLFINCRCLPILLNVVDNMGKHTCIQVNMCDILRKRKAYRKKGIARVFPT